MPPIFVFSTWGERRETYPGDTPKHTCETNPWDKLAGSRTSKKKHMQMNTLPTWLTCHIFSLNASPSTIHAQKLARRLFAVKLLTRYGMWRLQFTHQSWIIQLPWNILYTTIALRDYLLLHRITIYWYFFINIWMSSNFFECSIPVPHTTPAKMNQDAVGYSLNWRPGLSRTWNTSTRWCPSNIDKWHNMAQCLVLFSPTKMSLETRR